MNDKRLGDWLQTYTGKKFWPLDPRVEEVDIEDIAHALSNICRFGGHIHEFYSVAEHSWYLSYYCGEHALCGLLHDAAEAYVADVPSPLKKYLTNYKDIENRVMEVICEKFNLPKKMPAIVKEVDNRILIDEKNRFLKNCMPWETTATQLGISEFMYGLPPARAKQVFLNRFKELTNG